LASCFRSYHIAFDHRAAANSTRSYASPSRRFWQKVHPDSVAAGKTVGELPLPAECVLTAIIRKGELIIPRGDTVLQPADEVLSVVHAAQLSQLAALLGYAA